MDSTDIALPDLSENPDFNYDSSDGVASAGNDGWSLSGILGNIQSGVKIYGDVLATTSPRQGALQAQPTTLPAPQSPAGNISQMPASVGTHAGFIEKTAARLGVAAMWVWVGAGLLLVGSLLLIRKWIK